MKKLVLVAALVAAFGANAQSTYVEAGVGTAAVSLHGVSVTPTIARLTTGVNVNPNFAIEGVIGHGISAGAGDVNVGTSYGVFLKPKTKVANNVEVFGKVGRVSSRLIGGDESDRGTDTAYGVGANFTIDKKSYVSVDYTVYAKEGPAKVAGVAVSYGYKF